MEDYLDNDKRNKFYNIKTSSPGKILVCGGYLIINPKYRGLVLSTKTYFDCIGKIRVIEEKSNINDINDKNNEIFSEIFIKINSINFKTIYQFKIQLKRKYNEKGEDLGFTKEFYKENIDNFKPFQEFDDKYIDFETTDIKDNIFISSTMKTSFYFLFLFILSKIDSKKFIEYFQNKKFFYNIDLEADHRFYGSNQDIENSKINNNIKTGLGSSSALITSLSTNIILSFLKIFEFCEELDVINKFPDDIKLSLLLASYHSNNLAQNKIGSGFDINSCLFGSHIFQRIEFSTDILNFLDCNNNYFFEEKNISAFSKYKNKFLKEDIINNIKFIKKEFFTTRRFYYAILSLEIGTNTRDYVKKIMDFAYKTKNQEIFDNEIFQEINMDNESLIEIFSENKFHNERDLEILRDLNNNLRGKIRKLSSLANTELEPFILTEILNGIMNEGLDFGICPGAGGYDGVFVCGDKKNTYEIIGKYLENFNKNQKRIKVNYFPIEIIENGTIISWYNLFY